MSGDQPTEGFCPLGVLPSELQSLDNIIWATRRYHPESEDAVKLLARMLKCPITDEEHHNTETLVHLAMGKE